MANRRAHGMSAAKVLLLLSDGSEQTVHAAPGKTLNQTALDAAGG